MKTITELKARLKFGARLTVTDATHPHRYLNVVREIIAVRAKGVMIVPLGETDNASSLSYPKRSDVEFLSNDEFKITFWEGNSTTYKFVK